MRAKWKNLRTIILAVTATATFVGAAIFSFDVDPQELWDYFVLSALMLVAVMVSAFVLVMVFKLLRRGSRS